MKNEELLEFSQSSYQRVEVKRSGFLRRNLTLFAVFGFVLFVGTACAVLCFNKSATESIDSAQIITRSYQPYMQQYSRVLTVEVTPNSTKIPKDSNLHRRIESENMILNFYPIQKKPQHIIAIEVIDQQDAILDEKIDISQISYKNFQHDVHKPQTELFYLVLDNQGQFSKLLAESTVSDSQLEKVKHIVQQYTPELDAKLYETPKQYIRATKLGQARVQHKKVFEDSNKVIVKHSFNGADIAKASSFQNFDENNYHFEQTHHFSKNSNNLELSDLHEQYHFETAEHDIMSLGLSIQTHQKLELLKTKEISESKIVELMTKYYAMQDTSRQVFTLTPNELKHSSDMEFAQSVKDQLFPGAASCAVKERSLQQANDNIQMLTNQTFTVYNHPQQSFLGFSFQIIDEISIYVDTTNKTLIFDNSLVLQIQRDTCFKQFTLVEFSVPMTTNFTWDLNMIEVAAEAWLENLEDFFTNIYNKFQDFLKKIKAEGIHSNSSWTGIDSNSSRRLNLKGDLQTIEGDLSKWNQDIMDVLSHTSKQYHYSKPISYEYNLDFYGITLQFSFGFTFGLDGAYSDNLLDLYIYNKQVLINYIDILETDYNDDLQTAENMYKNLKALLQGCQLSGYSKEYELFKNWKCVEDSSELDYVCNNGKNKQNIHVTKKYYDYMQKELAAVPNECITTAVKDLMNQIIDQLKSFYTLRQSQFLDLLNLTYIPQFTGDVYVSGYMKITIVPWTNKLSMSIQLSGDLLQATADLSIQINVIPFFTNLVSLIEEDISSYQYLQAVESAVGFNFNFDVQVVNVTLTWIAAEAVVDLVLDVAEVMKNMWGTHSLRDLQAVQPIQQEDDSIFSDVFSDAASKFESGLQQVIADIYCEFFTNAAGIAEAFTPETVPLYQFLWANAGCSLPVTTLDNFSASMIQCSYSTSFQVVQLWDPSQYQTSSSQ